MDILNALKGKKTYLVSALLFVLGGSYALGWIDKQMVETLSVLLTGAGFAALRAGVK